MLIDINQTPFIARLRFQSGDEISITVDQNGDAVFRMPDHQRQARINRFELDQIERMFDATETAMLEQEYRADS